MSNYVRKTKDVYILQQHFGAYGWEDVLTEETRKEAREQLVCYRRNQPEYPARIVKRRLKVESRVKPLTKKKKENN